MTRAISSPFAIAAVTCISLVACPQHTPTIMDLKFGWEFDTVEAMAAPDEFCFSRPTEVGDNGHGGGWWVPTAWCLVRMVALPEPWEAQHWDHEPPGTPHEQGGEQ